MDLLDRFETDFEPGFPRHKSLSIVEKYIRGDDIPNPVATFAKESGISYEEIEEDDARILEEERVQMLRFASYYDADTQTDAPDSDSQMEGCGWKTKKRRRSSEHGFVVMLRNRRDSVRCVG